MKVFISWSGERSKRVAELLNDWIQCVIQAVDPWMSSKDIDRGALWFPDITDALGKTSVGIVCLTAENKEKPWILFEAGALAKGLSSTRVLPFLIDLLSTDVRDPLAQFNHTTPDKDGVWSLVRTINGSLGESALKDQVLSQVFETYWPQFKEKFDAILQETPTESAPAHRADEEILSEVLTLLRSMDRRTRALEIRQEGVIRAQEDSRETTPQGLSELQKLLGGQSMRFDSQYELAKMMEDWRQEMAKNLMPKPTLKQIIEGPDS